MILRVTKDEFAERRNKMTNIFKGDLTVRAREIYEYTEITGSLNADIYKNWGDFRTAFPKIGKIGGDLYLSSLTKSPKIKTNDAGARTAAVSNCRAMLLSSFAAADFSFADGILARIVAQRGNISRVIICGKTEVSYVITDGEGNHAHGSTLDEARADLMVKRTSGDLTQFKSWTLDKVVSRSDAILAYRSITGACAHGTRVWLEQRQTPDSLTVYTIIKLTRGAYGAAKFAEFFSEPAR